MLVQRNGPPFASACPPPQRCRTKRHAFGDDQRASWTVSVLTDALSSSTPSPPLPTAASSWPRVGSPALPSEIPNLRTSNRVKADKDPAQWLALAAADNAVRCRNGADSAEPRLEGGEASWSRRW